MRRLGGLTAVAVAVAGFMIALTATSAGAATVTQQTPGRDCLGDQDTITWAPSSDVGLTGYEVVQSIQTNPPTQHIIDVGPDQTSAPVTLGIGLNIFFIYTVTAEGRSATFFDNTSVVALRVPNASDVQFHFGSPNAVGDHSATVAFTPNGQAQFATGTLTGVTATPGGETSQAGGPQTFEFADLANGTPYQFSPVLTNACGTSSPPPAPLSNPFVPGLVHVTSPAILPAATLNQSYSFTLAATGGCTDRSSQYCSTSPGPLRWVPAAGTLPDGLSLDQMSGIISGTPTVPGSYSLTLEAHAPCYAFCVSDFATQTFTINVGMISVGQVSVASSANPSVIGQPVTFTATTTPGAHGTFRFYEGSTPIGSRQTTTGTASLTKYNVALGHHAVSVVFQGPGVTPSITSPAIDQVVGPASTSVSLTSDANPSQYGQSVRFTAVVQRNAPGSHLVRDGTVTFYDNGAPIGTDTVYFYGGTASIRAKLLAPGSHTITASYSGDDADLASTTASPVTQVVDAASTTTTLTVSRYLRAEVNHVTRLTGPVASGTVSFYDNGALLGTAPVVDGVALYKPLALAAGSHPITAVYSGSAHELTSTSGIVNTVIT